MTPILLSAASRMSFEHLIKSLYEFILVPKKKSWNPIIVFYNKILHELLEIPHKHNYVKLKICKAKKIMVTEWKKDFLTCKRFPKSLYKYLFWKIMHAFPKNSAPKIFNFHKLFEVTLYIIRSKYTKLLRNS